MRPRWFMLVVLATWAVSSPTVAQQAPPNLQPQRTQAQQAPSDLQTQRTQAQKSAYYAQVEYQRCRSDVIELLAKSEPLEKRIAELETDVAKLTEELRVLRNQGREEPPAK